MIVVATAGTIDKKCPALKGPTQSTVSGRLSGQTGFWDPLLDYRNRLRLQRLNGLLFSALEGLHEG